MVSKPLVLKSSVLDAREMGRNKDLSNFDKGHFVRSSLGMSISETTRLVSFSLSTVLRIYEKLPEKIKEKRENWSQKAH